MPAKKASSSLWTTLKRKPKPLSSSQNLFTVLQDRSLIENDRPDKIDYAEVERVVENAALIKPKNIKIKRNILNISYFVLKNPKTNQYFRLNKQEKFLWNNMDGQHTIRDLALEYYNKYGAFAYEKIVELVYDLKQKTFLEEEFIDIYTKLNFWAKSKRLLTKILVFVKKFIYFSFPLQNVDKFFSLIYQRFFKACYQKLPLFLIGLISMAGMVVFLYQSLFNNYSILAVNNSISAGLILLLSLNFISLLFHELAHGLTTKHFGRKVHSAGFLLYYGLPAFYVDTTDIWMEEKEKRIAVSMAGPLAQFFIASLTSIFLLFVPQVLLKTLLYKFSFVSYLAVFMNFNPFIEWDGYFILMDLLGIPCLRRRSFYFLKNNLIIKLKSEINFTKEEKIYTIFGILSAIWSATAIILAIRFWRDEAEKLLNFFK